MLRYLDAGESHGNCLVVILEGLPAGMRVDLKSINSELAERLSGYGRGPRAKSIETDKAEILSGIRKSETIGSPLALKIGNKDHSIDRLPEISRPRPGHADLPGALKYNQTDVRNILERASARETACRVAVGAICKQFLNHFNVEIISHVVNLGGIEAHTASLSFEKIKEALQSSKLRCADKAAEKLMIEEINKITESKDTLGGIFEVIAEGVVAGLGSHVHYDKRIDGRLAGSLMSIQAVKGVEIGLGFEGAKRSGSQVHDEIYYSKERGFYRVSNNAGGIEGGMTNGESLVLRCVMKPIPTLGAPLNSVDIKSKEPFKAKVERSDITAVPAAAVVAGGQLAFELARNYLEKFGGDTLTETKRNFQGYIEQMSNI